VSRAFATAPEDRASRADAGPLLADAVHRAAQILGEGFAVDAVGTWDRRLTTSFAGHLREPVPRWLEDPLASHDVPQYRLLAAQLPIAVGERLRLDEDPAALLSDIRPAALTIDVVGCGGLTRAVQITAAARQHGVPVYPHGRSMVPGIHLAAAFPASIPAVEYRCRWEPRRQLLYRQPWTPDRGFLPAPASAGLGTEPRRSR
jgi:L-alanine-DL-glutamate epimerase-like enolase superfamily enzyme